MTKAPPKSAPAPGPTPESSGKKPNAWQRMQLSERLLAIMLAVAMAGVLVSTLCFSLSFARILQGAKEGADTMSQTVHDMVESGFYQQETFLWQSYVQTQQEEIFRQLEALKKEGNAPHWQALTQEVYQLIDDRDKALGMGNLEQEFATQFLIADEKLYLYGHLDETAFLAETETFFKDIWEAEYFPNEGFWATVTKDPYGNYFYQAPDSYIMVWYPLEGGDRIGLFVSNETIASLSSTLDIVLDEASVLAQDAMETQVQQSLLGLFFALFILVLLLPPVARRLARVVVTPVEAEQERQEGLLQEAIAEGEMLAELDRLKTEFLANIAHELKTPLTVVSGNAQDARRRFANLGEAADPEERGAIDSQLGRISAEAERLGLLVSQVLDATQIQEGSMRLGLQRLSVVELLGRTVEDYYPLVTKNQNRLTLAIDPALPPVRADGARVSQVLVNLLSNAIRHTQDGEITVTAKARGAFVEVAVRDTGEGIPPEVMGLLFQRFRSGAGPSKGGTGLGIYIARAIIEAHGGEIFVESTPGVGTVMTFTLPVWEGDC